MVSRRSLVLGALLLAASQLTQPAPASAYVRTVGQSSGKLIYWNRTSITLIVHTANPPPPLTSEQVLRAARAAAAAWSRESIPCSPIELRVEESRAPTATVAADREFHVFFQRDIWCGRRASTEIKCNPMEIALTTVNNSKLDGHIVDMDVELNAAPPTNFRFADIVADPSEHGRANDLQGVLTHEFGHLMGFGHSCVAPDREIFEPPTENEQGQTPGTCGTVSLVSSVMLPSADYSNPVARTLSDDDVRGMCAVYGGLPREVEGSTSGCAVAGPPGDGHRRGPASPAVMLSVAAVAMAISRRRRRP